MAGGWGHSVPGNYHSMVLCRRGCKSGPGSSCLTTMPMRIEDIPCIEHEYPNVSTTNAEQSRLVGELNLSVAYSLGSRGN